MRGDRAFWAAAIVLAACGKGPAPAPAAAGAALPAPIPWPSTLEYVEHTQPGPMPAVADRVREVWQEVPGESPPEGFTGAVVEVITTHPDQDPEGRAAVRTRYVVGPEGAAHFAVLRPEGWVPYAPKVELPARVALGDRWSGVHGEGDRRNERTCEVEATPFCADGWAVACTIHWETRATWMRHHWCPADGWRGFEAVLNSGPLPMRIWSSGVSRDGVALPEVPIEARPLPEAPEIRPPAR